MTRPPYRPLLAIALSLAVAGAASADIIPGSLKNGDKVAVLGDSITEQRNYSAVIEDYLLMCQPRQDLQAAQFGWSGETTWGFKTRIKTDVLWFKPDVATICYGMNDGGYQSLDPQRLKEYVDSTKDIVRQLKVAGVRTIVLVGPGPVDTDAFNRPGISPQEYNKTLAALNDAAGDLAREQNLAFADLHAVMSEAMERFKQKHPGVPLAGPDGVHPDNNGHLVMAYAILKALGCDGDLGVVTLDMKADKAEARDGHKVRSCKDGSVEVESGRYPFQFINPPEDARGQRAGLDAVPFNADLNRFTLVVKNAPSQRVRVTWGGTSKEYDAAALAEGINLAAEFGGGRQPVPRRLYARQRGRPRAAGVRDAADEAVAARPADARAADARGRRRVAEDTTHRPRPGDRQAPAPGGGRRGRAGPAHDQGRGGAVSAATR